MPRKHKVSNMGNKFILLLELSHVYRLCLILAAVEKTHAIQTSDTPFQELTKKQGRSLRKESNTAKARYPCDFTFPERAIMVIGLLQAPETRARRLASGRNPKTSPVPLGPMPCIA